MKLPWQKDKPPLIAAGMNMDYKPFGATVVAAVVKAYDKRTDVIEIEITWTDVPTFYPLGSRHQILSSAKHWHFVREDSW